MEASICLSGSGAVRRRRERGFEVGHFGALLFELRFMREDVAEAALEARQPVQAYAFAGMASPFSSRGAGAVDVAPSSSASEDSTGVSA